MVVDTEIYQVTYEVFDVEPEFSWQRVCMSPDRGCYMESLEKVRIRVKVEYVYPPLFPEVPPFFADKFTPEKQLVVAEYDDYYCTDHFEIIKNDLD